MVGKTVLITGSTRGIGLALAQHYIKLGWNVIGATRDINNAEKVREEALMAFFACVLHL
jgi:NAD(P)-dependent dehydrogenase (short-subunit alcohol dehydrogenase family)